MRNVLPVALALLVGCAGIQIKLPPPPSKPGPVEPEKPEFLDPTVSFAEATVTEIGFVSATIDFAFDVENPNPVTVPLAGLAYAFQVDGNEILKGDEAKTLSLEPEQSTRVSIPVELKFIELGSTLIKLFRDKETLAYQLALTTTVTGPSGPQTADATGTGVLALPRLPKVSGADAKLGAMDLFGVGLAFELQVENPNPFPITLGEMTYGNLGSARTPVP
ncbi:MAG: LEA type 2 family protein, partial [Myxococcota bacterium]